MKKSSPRKKVIVADLNPEQRYISKVKHKSLQKLAKSTFSKKHRHNVQIKKQRKPVLKTIENIKTRRKNDKSSYGKFVATGISGFDRLFSRGIPKGSSVLVSGGAGTGKTIFCLQTLAYHALRGKTCYYMSFEESKEKLMNHMRDFGWNPEKLIKSGKLKIKRYSPFDITRSVDALLAKLKGELMIDLDPVILPRGFKPDFIAVDSLTALASAFTGREDSYRIYIEQLFRFFEKLGSTSFLITETKQMPKIFSTTGVEEFLADGVIVLYNLIREEAKENAVEVLKMRGERHKKKIVVMNITDKGIVVDPRKEVFWR